MKENSNRLRGLPSNHSINYKTKEEANEITH